MNLPRWSLVHHVQWCPVGSHGGTSNVGSIRDVFLQPGGCCLETVAICRMRHLVSINIQIGVWRDSPLRNYSGPCERAQLPPRWFLIVLLNVSCLILTHLPTIHHPPCNKTWLSGPFSPRMWCWDGGLKYCTMETWTSHDKSESIFHWEPSCCFCFSVRRILLFFICIFIEKSMMPSQPNQTKPCEHSSISTPISIRICLVLCPGIGDISTTYGFSALSLDDPLWPLLHYLCLGSLHAFRTGKCIFSHDSYSWQGVSTRPLASHHISTHDLILSADSSSDCILNRLYIKTGSQTPENSLH